MIKKPELLAPAGNLEKMKMALLYGADAVYLGGKLYGLRALGGNFTREELREAVGFAHKLKKKVYVTVNIFPHNSDLRGLPDYLRYLQEIGVDALLVADLGVFMMAKEYIPDMELHISTQANKTNWATVNAWQKLGAKRVVLAREMSLQEVREIREKTQADLEMFVLGPLPALELLHGPRFQPPQLCAVVPLEVRARRGDASGQVLPDRGGRARHLHHELEGHVPPAAHRRRHRERRR